MARRGAAARPCACRVWDAPSPARRVPEGWECRRELGITGICERGLCGAEEEGTGVPVLLLARCCRGIAAGVSCAAHPGAHRSQTPLVPVPAPPLGLSALVPTVVPVPAHSGTWQCPGVHLDPSGFHCLIPVTAHPSPPPPRCQPIPVPPVPSFGALSPELAAWQAMLVAMAPHGHRAPRPCAQPGKGTPCRQPQIPLNY